MYTCLRNNFIFALVGGWGIVSLLSRTGTSAGDNHTITTIRVGDPDEEWDEESDSEEHA